MALLARTGYIALTRIVPVRGLIVNKDQRTINNETIRRRTKKIQHDMESDEFEDGATVLEAGGKMLLLMLLQWSMSAEEEDEGLDETGLEANETYVGMEVDEGLGLDGANNGLGVDEGLGWDETYEGLEVDEGLGSGDLEVDDTPISTSTAL